MSTEEGGGHEPSRSAMMTTWAVLGIALVGVMALASVRFTQAPEWDRPAELRPLPPDGVVTLIAEPEMNDEYWPCSDCHEEPATTTEAHVLEEEHDALKLSHGDLWCFDCHDASDRQWLSRASGARVGFDETSKLCVQCHGDKKRDWETGVHGKRTGSWRGDKEYRPCVACHDPHDPPFKAMEPKPPPLRPGERPAPQPAPEASP